MSIYGQWLAATIPINTVTSAAVDLGRKYDLLAIQIPTVTSCTLKLTVSEILGGTYDDLGEGVTTDTTTGSYFDVWKLGGWRYIKVVSSATQLAERLIRVQGMAL